MDHDQAFPGFWLEGNQAWGEVRSRADLRRFVSVYGDRLAGARRGPDRAGLHNFGFRLEHHGEELAGFLEGHGLGEWLAACVAADADDGAEWPGEPDDDEDPGERSWAIQTPHGLIGPFDGRGAAETWAGGYVPVNPLSLVLGVATLGGTLDGETTMVVWTRGEMAEPSESERWKLATQRPLF
jgi:hypothetical protein